ncbi:unnamed protein product, partial [Meganyctiphanes norvegica]
MCKLCSFSSRDKSNAYNHASVHIQKLGNKLKPNCIIPFNYEYFVCTDCHILLMSKKDIQAHLQIHTHKNTSNPIVGVKYARMVGSNIKTILYCCTECNFGCITDFEILKHVKDHTFQKINRVEKDVYPRNANKNYENSNYPQKYINIDGKLCIIKGGKLCVINDGQLCIDTTVQLSYVNFLTKIAHLDINF